MNHDYYKKYEPIFGAWRITKPIGEGSFGKVFEIQREELNHTYKAALKAITVPQSQSEVESVRADGMTEEEVTKYFQDYVSGVLDEFTLMSKLKGNSNVVSYEDHRIIEHTDDIGWDILIRMELLTPLNKYIAEHGMTGKQVLQLGIDICKALELCEHYKIIHRDIKPENIFVSDMGDFKLGDFGIARTIERTVSVMSQRGTFSYMAPEVYRNQPYGANVDIYSLGIVLYRLLNGNRLPFLPLPPNPISYSDRTEAQNRRLEGEALPQPLYARGQVADVVLKACAYRPEDRYQSPTELKNILMELEPKLTSDLVLSPYGAELPGIKNKMDEEKSAPVVETKPEDDATAAVFFKETEDDATVDVFSGKRHNENLPTGAETEDDNTVSVFAPQTKNQDTDRKDGNKATAESNHELPQKKSNTGAKIGIGAAVLLAVGIGTFAIGHMKAPGHVPPEPEPSQTAVVETELPEATRAPVAEPGCIAGEEGVSGGRRGALAEDCYAGEGLYLDQ